MGTARTKLVTGLLRSRADADVAVHQILLSGHTVQDIGIIMSEQTRDRHFTIERTTQTVAGAGVGGAVGGAIGAVFAAIAAVGTGLVLPGIGLVVSGPIAAAFLGAGAGSATGGLIGALVGSGIPEYRARAYETALKDGGILIGVYARSSEDARALEKIFDDLGAKEVRIESGFREAFDSRP
jgi:hypothetical protein